MPYDPSGARRFVKETLGCRCPDDVFNRIEQEEVHSSGPGMPGRTRLLIGRRLLIYIWKVDETQILERYLPGIVHSGMRERDMQGYNRFRLVLSTSDPAKLEQAEIITPDIRILGRIHNESQIG